MVAFTLFTFTGSCVGAQPLLHSLPGGIRKFLAGGFYQFIGMFVGCVAKETDLLSVAATPFAEQKMNPKADALENWQFVIQRLGLKTAGLFAIR
jgi:hypothetical protein